MILSQTTMSGIACTHAIAWALLYSGDQAQAPVLNRLCSPESAGSMRSGGMSFRHHRLRAGRGVHISLGGPVLSFDDLMPV